MQGIRYLQNELEMDPLNLGKAWRSYLFFFSRLMSYEYFLVIRSVILFSNLMESSKAFIRMATLMLLEALSRMLVMCIRVMEQNSQSRRQSMPHSMGMTFPNFSLKLSILRFMKPNLRYVFQRIAFSGFPYCYSYCLSMISLMDCANFLQQFYPSTSMTLEAWLRSLLDTDWASFSKAQKSSMMTLQSYSTMRFFSLQRLWICGICSYFLKYLESSLKAESRLAIISYCLFSQASRSFSSASTIMMNFLRASMLKVRFFLAMSKLFKSLHMSQTISSDFLAFSLMMPISLMISFDSCLAFSISSLIQIFIIACSWISSISSLLTSASSALRLSISWSRPARDSQSGNLVLRQAMGSKLIYQNSDFLLSIVYNIE